MKKYFDFGDTGILLTVCKIQTAQKSPASPIMVGSNFCEHCKNNEGHGFDDGGYYIMCSAITGGHVEELCEITDYNNLYTCNIDNLNNKIIKLEQQIEKDREFINTLCLQQAESALEYNKIMTERAELIDKIKWILNSVYPSDTDPFKIGIKHSLSAKHWIETVSCFLDGLKRGGER